MNKRWAVLLASATLLIGLAIGGYVGLRFWQSFNEVALENRLIADAKIRLAILRSLQQSDNRKAVAQLEALLDGDVISMSAVMPGAQKPNELSNTLAQVAQYRRTSTHVSPEPTVAAHVSKVLEQFSPSAK